MNIQRNNYSATAALILFFLLACNAKENNSEPAIALAAADAAQSGTYAADEASPNDDSKGFANNQVLFTPPELEAQESKASWLSENTQTASQALFNKKKLIKNGRLSIKSNQIQQSKAQLDSLIKPFNAYYESEDLQNNTQQIAYSLKVRVPSIVFEKFVAKIESGSDELISKSIQADDVTEEFFDVQTRLENKRQFLTRYRSLLSKASSIKDILAIEENMRNLQEELEASEGRLKYLNDQVAYSTLEIYLFEEKEFVFKPNAKENFFERMKSSLSRGWDSVVDAVLLAIASWPIILLVLVFYFVIKIFKKRKANKIASSDNKE